MGGGLGAGAQSAVRGRCVTVETNVAERLRKARIAADYESAAEAADAMDLNFPTYASHENGTRGITARSLSRYAAFFEVNLAWLVDGTPPMNSGATGAVDILAVCHRKRESKPSNLSLS